MPKRGELVPKKGELVPKKRELVPNFSILIYEQTLISAKFPSLVPNSFFSILTRVWAEIVPYCAKKYMFWNARQHRPTRELVPKCQLFPVLRKRKEGSKGDEKYKSVSH